MPETENIALSCTNCGARLEITPDIDRFVCLHCGTQQIVRRGGGIVSLQPLVRGLERVQYGTDKTAAELAIKRLTTEARQAEHEVKEWGTMPLDDVVPPEIIEQLLPVAAVVALLGGFISVTIVEIAPCGGMLLSLILFCLYLYIRANRRQKAKERADAEVEVWSIDLQRLRGELEKNRRIVNM
ncbi:MAG: zinc ribbon domain-containing protein [Caldilineaceae bacterium]|nr:zinc ribbon domain-containing protein [Caldilineaceae bacterium]